MTDVWFTADLHLGHARICELSGRPFATVEDMNQALIERWNDTVGTRDTVWVLGDFAMGTIADTLPLGQRLHGEKHLILGNHDRPFMRRGKPDEQAWRDCYRDVGGFTEIHFGVDILLPTAPVPLRVLRLSHFPYVGDSQDVDRYPDQRPTDSGWWLLHGHVHEKWKINGRQINVGVDVWDFAPVHLDALLALAGGAS